MASTAKSAVSDYEHLKYRFGDENRIQLNESEDDDFLPLKARSKQINNQHVVPSHSNSNQNNQFSFPTKPITGMEFDSIEQVPIPSAWSPGMMVNPNPSLFITPEKLHKKALSSDLGSEKDNILEPRDLNKVPPPVPWIPHPDLRPSVFITPEKSAHADSTENEAHKLAFQTDTTKSKEKLSVRFTLPSSSLGDEFMDSSALSDSCTPITIKGKDDEENGLSKLSYPSRVYNPMSYSDDSVLDDSIPIPATCKKIDESGTVSLSTSANLVDKLNQLLTGSSGLYDQNSVTHSEVLSKTSKKDLSKNLISSSSSLSGPASSEQSSIKKVTSSLNSTVNVKQISGSKTSKRPFHHAKQNKSGPQHLSSSVSPYHPPNSGVCVVREGKHPMVSTDYSYPFQNVEDTQEHEHIFSRPEYNSTLKIRSELDNLCDQDVDLQKAVEVKLAKSSTKRTEIHEKAAVFTNQQSDQFTNLVDLEPAIDRLCDRVVRMRTCKAVVPRKGNKQPKKISSHKEPDLMEFYSGDLQKESPELSLPGVSPIAPDLTGAPHDQAFECYRHNRVWSGLRDF